MLARLGSLGYSVYRGLTANPKRRSHRSPQGAATTQGGTLVCGGDERSLQLPLFASNN